MTLHVLVVDDDIDIRDALAETFEDLGAVVTRAVHGQDALDKLREGPRPNVILLDLMMPVLDGRGFCEIVRQDPVLADVPIIVLSANQGAAAIANELGVASFLAKPFDLPELLATVDRYALPA